MTINIQYTAQTFDQDLQDKFSVSVAKAADVNFEEFWVSIKIFSITEIQPTASGLNIVFLVRVPASRNHTAVDEKAELIRGSLNVRIPFSFSRPQVFPASLSSK